MFSKETTLVVPTKERLDNLNRLFNSIKKQKIKFNEIIIVDASSKLTHERILIKFKKSKNFKIIKSNPSTSVQRNIGIKLSNKRNKFIMFCDDDIVFENFSFIQMDNLIKSNTNCLGFGFNLIEKNEKTNILNYLKENILFTKFGLYSKLPGKVCENGWHTKINNFKKDAYVSWLSTQACIYRSNAIKNFYFKTNLGKYSYLEDLFFSYRIYKFGKLIVGAKAKYKHPNFIERNTFNFGVQEIVNRYKFVKENKLNRFKFLITFLMKVIYELRMIFLGKFVIYRKIFGNFYGIYLCFLNFK